MTRLPSFLSFGRRRRAIKSICPVVAMLATLVLARGALAAPGVAVLCVAVEEHFVPSVPERAVIEAIRARVANRQLDVVACRHPSARMARWRLGVRRTEPGTIDIEARGDDVVLGEALTVDEGEPAEVARQIAIASAEMLRPTLIAWFDTSLLESPVAGSENPTEPPPKNIGAPPEPRPPGSAPWELALGVSVGGRYGGRMAAHASVAAEVRHRRWRLVLDGNGDLWSAAREGGVSSRFRALEAGGAVGRELVARCLWLDVGAQARFTRASITGPSDVLPRVGDEDWGFRSALSAVIWRNAGLELGVTARVSWWYQPMRLLYEGQELQRQTHIDLLVAPYFAAVL